MAGLGNVGRYSWLMSITPMIWADDHLKMLDQRLLPMQEVWIELRTWQSVRDAIRDMAVRGAPAIGVAAGYGLALAALSGDDMTVAAQEMREARPTAVNLMWAVDRIMGLGDLGFEAILAEAKAIEKEDLAMNLAIGRHGAELLKPGSRVMTICNTGSLATAGHGTALGVIRTAYEQGKVAHVYSCETRPRMQGLRLTAWELLKDGIPFQSISDNMAATLMKEGKVDLVIAGADRIAANGDSANKIGTYMLAVCAAFHKIPFYIAAPSSTFDTSIPDGSHIPIEERTESEITEIEGVRVAPVGVKVYNPGFDVTPGELIEGIITEAGVYKRPYSFQK